MAWRSWYPGIGVLACVACGPTVGAGPDGGDESSSTGATPPAMDGESSADDGTGSMPAEDGDDDDAVDESESESGEPSEPPRCLELVGLPVSHGQTLAGFADLDGDALRELVIEDVDGTVSIFSADAAIGPWTGRQTLAGVNRVHDIGDVDGDGRDDLLVGSAEGSDWWRAGADGALAFERSLGSGWLEDRLVLVADPGGGPASLAEIVDGELALARGMGDGTFVAASDLGSPDADVSWFEPIVRVGSGVLAVDRWQNDCIGFCTDGHDVLTIDGELSATVHYVAHGTIIGVAHTDDAIPDTLVLDDDALELRVDGTEAVAIADDVTAARLGDLDGDGALDLALLTADRGVVRWGEGASWSAPELLPSAAPDGVVAPERTVDVDGDGRDELVVMEAGRYALVLAQPCSE